ncbi:Pyridoxal phosphate homeostasis protein [Sinobacterium norvegicum]|uniref:Pyridoxal phosphate homeostasis protein n=1 Tax=Sinobacterium norvegicum TaxID=1641715 RepID=A0ABM9AI82_9GAMM|nr:YggS family pyridoxal phosphate-dependent enzyme [Sinobacterium norvegicum]CAH0992938.1 Pyridoxal phosphate homeostasis protein [Sinobacterium norvegicum]
MIKIADKVNLVHERIANACQLSGRKCDEVQLLAVSKTRSPEEVAEAYQQGCRDFGENYLQDALGKISATALEHCRWHFIGKLQSNKTRAVAEHFDWMHTVDRLKIAQRLSEQRPATLPPLNICLQVNISGEESKSGIAPAELISLAEKISALSGVKLRGLMVIPAASNEPEQQRSAFANSYQLYRQLQQRFDGIDTLSMGMSGDLEAAIAEGSTIVRVGTDIFGPRAV